MSSVNRLVSTSPAPSDVLVVKAFSSLMTRAVKVGYYRPRPLPSCLSCCCLDTNHSSTVVLSSMLMSTRIVHSLAMTLWARDLWPDTLNLSTWYAPSRSRDQWLWSRMICESHYWDKFSRSCHWYMEPMYWMLWTHALGLGLGLSFT